ncbi:hypothetical protein DPMN_043093 [Dreissena polymorpha]|uniref:Uncharacterized protein n=1 Tax=Dreissena polymorpha TaxID=45954 RepID=A0A9D4HXM1_DREPO|nr:hypothetical protein DPMN_043093 [Dreissena polymorpha]
MIIHALCVPTSFKYAYAYHQHVCRPVEDLRVRFQDVKVERRRQEPPVPGPSLPVSHQKSFPKPGFYQTVYTDQTTGLWCCRNICYIGTSVNRS